MTTLSPRNLEPAPAKSQWRMRAERRHQLANAAAVLRIVADGFESEGATYITPADLRAVALGWEKL